MQKTKAVEIYRSKQGDTQIQVNVADDSVWLSLKQMAELFGRDESVLSRHIKNIFASGELKKKSVMTDDAVVAADGKTYVVDFYNLDLIISVG